MHRMAANMVQSDNVRGLHRISGSPLHQAMLRTPSSSHQAAVIQFQIDG